MLTILLIYKWKFITDMRNFKLLFSYLVNANTDSIY